MTANDSKSYLHCLNKLVDQYHNICHYSINEKRCTADCLIENIEIDLKSSKFKVNNRMRLM